MDYVTSIGVMLFYCIFNETVLNNITYKPAIHLDCPDLPYT